MPPYILWDAVKGRDIVVYLRGVSSLSDVLVLSLFVLCIIEPLYGLLNTFPMIFLKISGLWRSPFIEAGLVLQVAIVICRSD